MLKRWGASLLVGGVLLAWTGTAVAETVEVVPAAPGSGEATAVEVGTIRIGHTKAKAGPSAAGDDSEATANAVEMSDKPLSDQVGGTQKGKGKKSGAFYDSKDTPLGRLRLAPWEAGVDGDAAADSPRKADSSAALARLVLVNSGVLEVNVAQSESHATHNGLDSTGAASSDGATVKGANAITLVVLHAETTSAGKGETYLLNVNGNKIGTDKQISQCPLAVGPLAEIKVNCVKATGANGVTKVTADALGALVTPAGLGVKAASAAGSSAQGSATQVLSAPALEAPAPAPAAQLPARKAPLLPRTGATGLGVLSLLGVALATVGASLRYLAGRPVSEAVSPAG